MADEVNEVVQGDGYAVGNVDAMAEGPGFRKVRRELGVTAFGVNAASRPVATSTTSRRSSTSCTVAASGSG